MTLSPQPMISALALADVSARLLSLHVFSYPAWESAFVSNALQMPFGGGCVEVLLVIFKTLRSSRQTCTTTDALIPACQKSVHRERELKYIGTKVRSKDIYVRNRDSR